MSNLQWKVSAGGYIALSVHALLSLLMLPESWRLCKRQGLGILSTEFLHTTQTTHGYVVQCYLAILSGGFGSLAVRKGDSLVLLYNGLIVLLMHSVLLTGSLPALYNSNREGE